MEVKISGIHRLPCAYFAAGGDALHARFPRRIEASIPAVASRLKTPDATFKLSR